MRSRQDRDNILRCPFCRTPLRQAVDIENPYGGTVYGGFCGCGTVFVYDRSGRMLGEAYSEALALAFSWDYDAAMNAPEGSYEEAVVRFDAQHNMFYYGEGHRLDRSSKFYFIRREKKV